MNWTAVPGGPANFEDYRGTLRMVPGVQTFPEGVASIDFSSGAYRIEITDSDDALLEDQELEDDELETNASERNGTFSHFRM
jgi:hypothetical protein